MGLFDKLKQKEFDETADKVFNCNIKHYVNDGLVIMLSINDNNLSTGDAIG